MFGADEYGLLPPEYRAEWSLVGKDEAKHTQFQWAERRD